MRNMFQILITAWILGTACIISVQAAGTADKPPVMGGEVSDSARGAVAEEFLNAPVPDASRRMTEATPAGNGTTPGTTPGHACPAGGGPEDAPAECSPAGLHHWFNRMTPGNRAKARAILQEFRPVLKDLKRQMAATMLRLEELTYCQETDPQALPALGQELQTLRRRMKKEFEAVNRRLQEAVGCPLPPPHGRGYRAISNILPE